MGLDTVEFVLAVEDAFDVAIPDQDAAALVTPADVINYLDRVLTQSNHANTVIVQRAFHRVRSALVRHHGQTRRSIHPDTRLTSLWKNSDRKRAWLALKQQLLANKWPPTPSDGLMARYVFAQPHTVGDLAQHLAAYNPRVLLSPEERWTRTQIEEIVRQLVEHQFSLTRDSYTLQSRFIQDLHID